MFAKMQRWFRRCTLVLVAGLVLSFGCSTYIKIPVVTSMPDNFMQTMRGGKRVALVLVPAAKGIMSLNDFGDYESTIEGAVAGALSDYRYFDLVDISSRKTRLKEIAHSMSGLTRAQQGIGKELNVDAFLFVQIPQSPKHDCRYSSSTRVEQECIYYDNKNNCTGYRDRTIRVNTATLTMTVYVQGRLVNVESGRTISHQATNVGAATGGTGIAGMLSRFGVGGDSSVFTATSENAPVQCPSVLNAFGKSVRVAAYRLADKISPKVTDYPVVVDDDPIGSPEKAEDRVKKLLKKGNKWAEAEPPNLEQAAAAWTEALDASGGKSASAHWNLAVAAWARSDYDAADKHFKLAETTGGPDFMSSKKNNVRSKFLEERKRVMIEREKESLLDRVRRIFYAVTAGWLPVL